MGTQTSVSSCYPSPGTTSAAPRLPDTPGGSSPAQQLWGLLTRAGVCLLSPAHAAYPAHIQLEAAPTCKAKASEGSLDALLSLCLFTGHKMGLFYPLPAQSRGLGKMHNLSMGSQWCVCPYWHWKSKPLENNRQIQTPKLCSYMRTVYDKLSSDNILFLLRNSFHFCLYLQSTLPRLHLPTDLKKNLVVKENTHRQTSKNIRTKLQSGWYCLINKNTDTSAWIQNTK